MYLLTYFMLRNMNISKANNTDTRHTTALSNPTRLGSYHGSDFIEALEVLHYPALVCRLHPGEAAHRPAGLALQVGGQLVKLPPCEAAIDPQALLLLLLFCDDAHPPTDGQGCAFVVAWKERDHQLN